MSIEFLPKHYAPLIHGSPSSGTRFGYWWFFKQNFADMRVEMTVFDDYDFDIKDLDVLTWTEEHDNDKSHSHSLDLFELFEEKYENPYHTCIKRIDVYLDNVTYPMDIRLDNFYLDGLALLNPKVPDYTEAYVNTEKAVYNSGEDIKIEFNLYFGHETQKVDLYFVIYDTVDLFFFPSYTTKVEFITLTLPQFTRIPFMELTTINIDFLPFREADNQMVFAIAKHGTLDFFHDLHIRTIRLLSD